MSDARTGPWLAVDDGAACECDAGGLQRDGPVLVLARGLGRSDKGVHGGGEVLEDDLLVVHAHGKHAVQECRHRLHRALVRHDASAIVPPAQVNE